MGEAVCNIFGCTQKAIFQCPRCGNHYCEDHIQIHIHGRFFCPGCTSEFPTLEEREAHIMACQSYKDRRALEAKLEAKKERGEQLTRKEIQDLTGVSPSTQRRDEKVGLEAGFLIKDEDGRVWLNPDVVKIGPRVRLHQKKKKVHLRDPQAPQRGLCGAELIRPEEGSLPSTDKVALVTCKGCQEKYLRIR